MTDEDYLSPVIQNVIDQMRLKNLTVAGFRDRRGRLRYVLSNNEIIVRSTAKAMIERGILEMIEAPDEARKLTEVHYRLKNP